VKTIRMLTLSAGPAGCFPAGSVREVEDSEAAALLAGKFAVIVEPAKKAQAAAADADTHTGPDGKPQTRAERRAAEAAKKADVLRVLRAAAEAAAKTPEKAQE